MAKRHPFEGKRVVIRSIEQQAQRVGFMTFPGQTFEEAFGDVNDLSTPMHACNAAMNWAWVEWHRTGDRAAISERLAFVCGRSADAVRRNEKADPDWRGRHDWLMVACGVLSDSEETLANALVHFQRRCWATGLPPP